MNYAREDTLVMIVELTIQPDKVEAFLDYTAENLKLSRDWPGNIAFDILIDEAQPERVLFYEVWESAAVQQAYMAWRVEQGDLTTLMAFLSGPPKFTPLRSISGR